MRINRNRFKPLSLNLEHSSQSGPAHLFSFLCKVVSPGSPFIPQLIKCWHSWLVTGQPANPGEMGKILLCWECGPTSLIKLWMIVFVLEEAVLGSCSPCDSNFGFCTCPWESPGEQNWPTFQILLDCLALIFTLSLVFDVMDLVQQCQQMNPKCDFTSNTGRIGCVVQRLSTNWLIVVSNRTSFICLPSLLENISNAVIRN